MCSVQCRDRAAQTVPAASMATGPSPLGTAARFIQDRRLGCPERWPDDLNAANWVNHTQSSAAMRTEDTMVINSASRIVESVDDPRGELDP